MTIKSMTAYSNAEAIFEDSVFTCEIKTLNSRYAEVNVRLPRFLMALETEIISVAKETLARGKIEINLNVRLAEDLAQLPALNESAMNHYLAIMKQMQNTISDKFPNAQDRVPTVNDLIRLDGVLDHNSKSQTNAKRAESFRAPVLESLKEALSKIVSERANEGASLHKAFVKMVEDLETERMKIAEKSEAINKTIYENYVLKLENFQAKLKTSGLKVAEDLPSDRLLTEISIIADKCDIEEELTRLQTHTTEFSSCLAVKDPIGRKLDFLCQELHREVNTISNKLTNTDVAKHTLAMKQTVERIKQQVQNIE